MFIKDCINHHLIVELMNQREPGFCSDLLCDLRQFLALWSLFPLLSAYCMIQRRPWRLSDSEFLGFHAESCCQNVEEFPVHSLWSLRTLPKWNGPLRCKGHFFWTQAKPASLLSPASPAVGWHHCSPIKPGPFPAAAALRAVEKLKGLSCVTFSPPPGQAGVTQQLT